MRPVISVLMPNYNGMPCLGEAVGSILNQTYRDFELVVMDDGSTDDSLDFLTSVDDNRLKICACKHRGLVDTLNSGLDLCDTEIIARMDSDDIAFPNRLEKQLAYVLDNKLDGCGCWIKFFGDEDRVMEFPESPGEVKAQLFERTTVAHPTYLFHRWVYNDFRYDPLYGYAEDVDFLLRVTEKYRIGNVPEVLLWYRSDYKRCRSCEDVKAQAACVERARTAARERRGL